MPIFCSDPKSEAVDRIYSHTRFEYFGKLNRAERTPRAEVMSAVRGGVRCLGDDLDRASSRIIVVSWTRSGGVDSVVE